MGLMGCATVHTELVIEAPPNEVWAALADRDGYRDWHPVLVPERLLNQRGGIWGMLTFDHRWELEPVEGGTRLVQHEEYRGLFLPFWDYSWVEPAYAKANEGLKRRVEAGAGRGE